MRRRRALALHGAAEAPARHRESARLRLRSVAPRARRARDRVRAAARTPSGWTPWCTGPHTGSKRCASACARASSARSPNARTPASSPRSRWATSARYRPEQWQTFTRTGVNHLMSISGLHVTMVSGLAYALALALWRRSARLTLRLPAPKAAALAGVAAAFLYTLLAGFAVPAQRTLYMVCVVAAALWTGPAASASVVLAAALLVVLLLDPWAVTSAGFWLSFGAVGGDSLRHGEPRRAAALARRVGAHPGRGHDRAAAAPARALSAGVDHLAACERVCDSGGEPRRRAARARRHAAAVRCRARPRAFRDGVLHVRARLDERAARGGLAAARARRVGDRGRARRHAVAHVSARRAGALARRARLPAAVSGVSRGAALGRGAARRARRRAGARGRRADGDATRCSTTPAPLSARRPTAATASSRRICARRACAVSTA